jgi:hypothetical protein
VLSRSKVAGSGSDRLCPASFRTVVPKNEATVVTGRVHGDGCGDGWVVNGHGRRMCSWLWRACKALAARHMQPGAW